jgi:SAM-dependent methyltransferase
MKIKSLVSRVCRKARKKTEQLIYALNRTLGIPQLSYCPACEKKVISWLPLHRDIGHGEKKIEPGGRMCPHCRTLERTRHFSIYIKQKGILESSPRLLHFAPESSLAEAFRAKLGKKYVSTDLFMEGVDQKQDITKMTFEDHSFDFIYCSNVLEHIEDDHAAMSELFRVLTPIMSVIMVRISKGAWKT